jgi:hypothetical protein
MKGVAGAVAPPAYRARVRRPPPLVAVAAETKCPRAADRRRPRRRRRGKARVRSRAPRGDRRATCLAEPGLALRGFEARPAGIRAILPYVDEFLPVHNVAPLTDISAALDPVRKRSARRPPPAAAA